MKKYIYYMIGLILTFSACKKIEDAPTDSVDARLNEKMAEYQTQLASGQFGWKGYLLTASKIPLIFTFKFDDKNRVVMSANFRAGTPESSYRLKALQLPTLIFDTYSLLHLVSDPDPGVIGGNPGEGFASDFEFGIVSSSADTIHLVGLTNKSKLTLIRATSNVTIGSIFSEMGALESSFSKLKTYFKRTKIGDTECEISINPGTRVFSVGYLDGTTLKTSSSNYYVSGTTISFFDPLEVGKIKISSLGGINFNASSGFVSGQLNGSEIQIKEAAAPMQYNKNDAPNFMIGPSGRSWWECYAGFTIDGASDAYGIKSIAGFADLDYYVTGTNKGNLQCWVGTRYFAYYPKIASTISADGFLINTVTSTVGSTTNAAAKTIIDNTTQAFIEPKGFYVIRVGNAFDLVSVKDARSWLTFE